MSSHPQTASSNTHDITFTVTETEKLQYITDEDDMSMCAYELD